MDKAAGKRHYRVRRQGRGKLLRYLLAAAAMLAAVALFFEISDIQVEGNVIYSKGELLTAAELREGGNFFLIRRKAAEKRLEESLSCVEHAEVGFRLPNTLVIRVEEGPAVAWTEAEEGVLLLSARGRVVGIGGDTSGLLHIGGITPVEPREGEILTLGEADTAKLEYLTELLRCLSDKELLGAVKDLDIANVSDLHFVFDGRFSVRMGGRNRVSEKLDFLQRIVGSLGNGETGVIDLSTDMEGHFIPG